MRFFKTFLFFLLISAMSIGNAFAHSRTRTHVYFGVGPYWGWPGPYYHHPQTVIIEQRPPVIYIEQQQEIKTPPAPPPANQYWYYCEAKKGYYPYVKECPVDWMKVVPQAPQQ